VAFHVPEASRITAGPVASDPSDGNNGAFLIDSCEPGWKLALIASDGGGWEHVSVQAIRGKKDHRVPTWREMAFVKATCWDDEDVVIQYHPRKSEYVNQHPYVLHLWRPIGVELPTPPPIMVGVLRFL
jgi:hypothetical protein